MTDVSLHEQKKWILASNNKGKLAEFQSLFDSANLGIQLIAQKEMGIEEAEETGLSFIENAIIKARHASEKSGLPAIADDSGLCVPVLGGMPGIYSARYAGEHGNDLANNQKLIAELQPYRSHQPIIGQFVCVLAMVHHAKDPLPMIAQGIWQGEVLSEPKGENGFGYDPVFWLPEQQKSCAQLTNEQKNKISHRAQALQLLLQQIHQANP